MEREVMFHGSKEEGEMIVTRSVYQASSSYPVGEGERITWEAHGNALALGTITFGRDGLNAQFFDSYGTQRELSITLEREAGKPLGSRRVWKLHAYAHAPRWQHMELEISHGKALRIIRRMNELVTSYPTLLFNPERYGRRGRNEGLVMAHERFLAGDASVKALG